MDAPLLLAIAVMLGLAKLSGDVFERDSVMEQATRIGALESNEDRSVRITPVRDKPGHYRLKLYRLGGALAFGPMDIPHVGRFAVVRDPQGVTFTIMRGDSAEPSRAFVQMAEAKGHGVWIELATPDPDAAFAFYGALFGFEKVGAMPMGDMGEYAFIGRGEAFRPGAVMSSATTGAPARWNWYVNVPDIDAAIATAKERGGTLIQGPDPIPGGDYSANLADPQGHQIGLVGPRKEK